ncbi:unannotated protein [freshwater metagenome]|uniref:Unannotated protein n=1 Tax=freshwater metagenome TaxID=449393 RepID=A0A6J6NYC4_9ZZZZ
MNENVHQRVRQRVRQKALIVVRWAPKPGRGLVYAALAA